MLTFWHKFFSNSFCHDLWERPANWTINLTFQMKTKDLSDLIQQKLTLSRLGGGALWPPYHESVCHCHKVRATLTKLPDFVPFDICQVPESQFWCLFFKKLKTLDVEKFWSPRALCEIWKKINSFFLLKNPIFSGSIWIIYVLSFHLRCHASKLLEFLVFLLWYS